jgi:hypothetical protein
MTTALAQDRQVLVNLEINKSCHLTSVCGDTCVLNLIEKSLPQAQLMDPVETFQAACEVIDHGQHVRHLAIVGKEVLETPDLLFAILERYHAANEATRPGAVSIITSGLLLHKYLDRFAELPLSGCQVSLDSDSTGLHIAKRNQDLLSTLLALREQGGASLVSAISVLTETNLDALVLLGQQLCSSGIDQWSLGPLLLPQQGVMKSAVSISTIRKALERLVQELGQSAINQIILGLELPEFEELFGETVPPDKWRAEKQIPNTNVWAIALSMRLDKFIRLRWDGQLISKSDVRRLGRKEGAYGRYQSGRLASLLESW